MHLVRVFILLLIIWIALGQITFVDYSKVIYYKGKIQEIKTSVHVFLPLANEVWGKVIFLHQFVILFTGGGACVVAPGGWHAWLLLGGCMVALGGHAWLFWGGGVHVYSGGHAWLLPGGVHGCLGGMHGCSRRVYMVAPGGMCGCSSGACVVAPRGCVHGCSQGGVCGCSQGGVCGCSPGGAWDMMRYGDTINERVVHILLECILVVREFCCLSDQCFVFKDKYIQGFHFYLKLMNL